MNNKQDSILLIGCGNMGTALAQSIRKSHPDIMIYVTDQMTSKSQKLMEGLGQPCQEWPQEEKTGHRIAPRLILFGVKPHDLSDAINYTLSEELLATEPILVSMAVATSLSHLEDLVQAKWIRIMPNTPVSIGKGLIAYQANEQIQEEEMQFFQDLFKGCGRLTPIEERLFDAFAAIAGSGPAFVMMMIEAISDAGVFCGLSRETALELASETLIGSTEWQKANSHHPARLKDMVTSPGGTTIAGIRHLEASGMRSALIEAIIATYERAQELSQ